MNQKATILLVDDEEEILRGTSLWLTAAGHDTLTARNGADAFDMANESQPDAIVMDVRMPVEDGLAALGRLQNCERSQRIPVVMLSASLVDKERALDAGASYFLTKPYQGRELVDVVDSIVQSR